MKTLVAHWNFGWQKFGLLFTRRWRNYCEKIWQPWSRVQWWARLPQNGANLTGKAAGNLPGNCPPRPAGFYIPTCFMGISLPGKDAFQKLSLA